jgi:hypothetical protein
MRMKSKGLGNLELVGRPEQVKREGDHMILSLRTEGSVPSNVRVALDHRDIIRIVRLFLTSSAPLFLVSGVTSRKNPKPPEGFQT